jgi:hypothetical protein
MDEDDAAHRSRARGARPRPRPCGQRRRHYSVQVTGSKANALLLASGIHEGRRLSELISADATNDDGSLR